MNGWLTLWTTVLLGALTMFTSLAVVVTIGGFLDIRKMLRELGHQRTDETPDKTP